MIIGLEVRKGVALSLIVLQFEIDIAAQTTPKSQAEECVRNCNSLKAQRNPTFSFIFSTTLAFIFSSSPLSSSPCFLPDASPFFFLIFSLHFLQVPISTRQSILHYLVGGLTLSVFPTCKVFFLI